MQGDHQKAIEVTKLSLQLDPNDIEALGNLGVAYLEIGEPQEAEYTFYEAILRKPYDPQIHVYMAIALYHQRKYEDAILRADEALRIDPEYQQAIDLI